MRVSMGEGKGTKYSNCRNLMVKCYKHLFTSSCSGNIENILERIPNSITDQINQELTKPVMEEEIRIAVFSMDPVDTKISILFKFYFIFS